MHIIHTQHIYIHVYIYIYIYIYICMYIYAMDGEADGLPAHFPRPVPFSEEEANRWR